MDTIRVGIIGLGANTRLRHVPGLRACPQVEISGVCNRSSKSTEIAAAEFKIPKTYQRWEHLVEDPQIDAVVVGTWPYLHCPVTLAALETGKHVLTEARMAMNADQARQMLDASRARPDLIAQVVPSPLGLRAGRTVERLLAEGFIGTLREVVVLGTNNASANPETPLHWRQSAKFSGNNMLALGILHEPLTRWIPQPTSVYAQTQVFTAQRPDPVMGTSGQVGCPDSAHVLAEFPEHARGVYHLSAAIHFGPGMQIHLYGSEGTLKYLLSPEDQLLGGRHDAALREIEVPPEEISTWRVEEEFINSIRGLETVELNDFETGLRSMDFTDAVARSAQTQTVVRL